jgi:hypothetical protein
MLPKAAEGEFSAEPGRGGQYRRSYRLPAHVEQPKMQIPAGYRRQGSAERMTDGEQLHPVARHGPAEQLKCTA